MKTQFDDNFAINVANNPLAMRVYTSRLLGLEPSLVLHGGGNTSVKTFVDNEHILYVKGSGWDLATIEKEGFAPVKMQTLLDMANLEHISDTDMVSGQRAAMIDKNAPTPSVEAILHAIIPFDYVDHTHADAVVTLTNTPNGNEKIKQLYGEKVLIVPYVMPGFILAKTVYEMTKDINWAELDGIVLMNHGIFTFSNDAKQSYEKMIELVSMAEDALKLTDIALQNVMQDANKTKNISALELAKIRKAVSIAKGGSVVAIVDNSDLSKGFSAIKNIVDIATKCPLTPDHIIRTKQGAAVIEDEKDIALFAKNYEEYFKRHAKNDMKMIAPYPCFAVYKNCCTISFGVSVKDAKIIHDIKKSTMEAIIRAQALGGWSALNEAQLFEMEYWELEQAKLKKGGTKPELEGKIVFLCDDSEDIYTQKGGVCVRLQSAQDIEKSLLLYGGVDMLIGANEEIAKACAPYLEYSC